MSDLHADTAKMAKLGESVASVKTKLHEVEVQITNNTPGAVDWALLCHDVQSLLDQITELSIPPKSDAPEPYSAPEARPDQHRKGHK